MILNKHLGNWFTSILPVDVLWASSELRSSSHQAASTNCEHNLEECASRIKVLFYPSKWLFIFPMTLHYKCNILVPCKYISIPLIIFAVRWNDKMVLIEVVCTRQVLRSKNLNETCYYSRPCSSIAVSKTDVYIGGIDLLPFASLKPIAAFPYFFSILESFHLCISFRAHQFLCFTNYAPFYVHYLILAKYAVHYCPLLSDFGLFRSPTELRQTSTSEFGGNRVWRTSHRDHHNR